MHDETDHRLVEEEHMRDAQIHRPGNRVVPCSRSPPAPRHRRPGAVGRASPPAPRHARRRPERRVRRAPEAVITGVEDGAEITFWTFYLSPTFDDYIKDTIARFNEAYPGVTVNWDDHQATFQRRPRQRVRRRQRAGRHQPLGQRGLGPRLRQQGPAPRRSTTTSPTDVKSMYFEGLWNQQLVDGENFQFPWYQGIAVDLINTQIYTGNPVAGSDPPAWEGGADLKVEDFPKTIDGLPALCQTIKDKTGKLCDIRLTVTDLLAQMVYEGDVEVISRRRQDLHVRLARGGRVAPDVRRHGRGGHRRQSDRPVSRRRPGRPRPVHLRPGPVLPHRPAPHPRGPLEQPGPVRLPRRRAGAARQVRRHRQGPDGHLRQGRHQVPERLDRARPVLHEPQSMLEFAKIVPIYPSTPASYDDPFFSGGPGRDRGQRQADRQGHRLHASRHRADDPDSKADVNEIVAPGASRRRCSMASTHSRP